MKVNSGDVLGYVDDDKHNGRGPPHLHIGIRLTASPGPDKWVYFGYENMEKYPESAIGKFAAFSEFMKIIQSPALFAETPVPEGFNQGAEIFAQLGHTAAVASVAFSPDGRFALSGSVDKTLLL